MHNIRIVIHIAHKFKNTGIEMDDLVSIGTIGLIKAADTFNHNRPIKFSTYAVSCVRNEILMYIRKKTHEIAATSLDEPINEDSKGNQLVLSDTLCAEDVIDKRLEDAGNRQILESAFSKLTPREKNLIDLRFGLTNGGEGMTQRKLCEFIKVTQAQTSRLEKKIRIKLKKVILLQIQRLPAKAGRLSYG